MAAIMAAGAAPGATIPTHWPLWLHYCHQLRAHQRLNLFIAFSPSVDNPTDQSPLLTGTAALCLHRRSSRLEAAGRQMLSRFPGTGGRVSWFGLRYLSFWLLLAKLPGLLPGAGDRNAQLAGTLGPRLTVSLWRLPAVNKLGIRVDSSEQDITQPQILYSSDRSVFMSYEAQVSGLFDGPTRKGFNILLDAKSWERLCGPAGPRNARPPPFLLPLL